MELTRQAVHLIETGKVRPSMRSLRVLAHRLHVPVTSLLAPSDSRGPFDQDSIAEIERLCRNHQYDQALARGAEILEWSRSPELIAGAHSLMGDALCRLDRPDEAMEHLAQARELYEALEDDRGRVAETMELEALALQIKEDPRALTVAREALLRYRESDHRRPEVESRLLQRVGTILTAHREFGQALRYYDEALQVAGGVRDLMRLARLYHGLAICQQGDGDVRLAADLLFKAHTLYEAEERLADATSGSDLARVENDLAVLLIRQGDIERGEEFLVSSIRRFQEAGLHRRLSSALLSLAELRQGQARLAEAEDLLGQAIDLAGQLKETHALGAGHRQLGELLAVRGELDRAAENFDRALEILREAGLDQRYAECVAVRDRALGLSRHSEASGSIA